MTKYKCTLSLQQYCNKWGMSYNAVNQKLRANDGCVNFWISEKEFKKLRVDFDAGRWLLPDLEMVNMKTLRRKYETV